MNVDTISSTGTHHTINISYSDESFPLVTEGIAGGALAHKQLMMLLSNFFVL